MSPRSQLAPPPVVSKLLCSFCFFLFFSVAAMAQTVTGKVNNASGQPIPGVTVTVKGTNRAAVSNDAGNFTISAAGTDVLVFSYVGFPTQEIPIDGKSNITVNMTSETRQNLDEVVVTALGIRRAARS